jgi:hypothetical protein
MTRQNGNFYSDDWVRQGKPTNTTFAETIPRYMASANGAIAASGVVLSAGIVLHPGDKVTNITFVTATTGAGTPTAGFVALYSPAGALLAQSADFGSTARAANTAFTVALATAQLITESGLYYAAISFTASTVPTLKGFDLGNASVAGAIGLSVPVLVQSHGSGVGATAPATIATPTTTSVIPYLVAT